MDRHHDLIRPVPAWGSGWPAGGGRPRGWLTGPREWRSYLVRMSLSLLVRRSR